MWPYNLNKRKTIVSEVSQVAANAHSAIAAEYRGLTVVNLLNYVVKRVKLGVYLKVVKNTLSKTCP